MGKLAAIFPQPGVFREGTQYAAENRWYDSQWIRWRKGFPEAMGGWVNTGVRSLGIARKLHDWGTVTGANYLGVGTTLKLYVDDGGTLNDITPEKDTVTLGTDPISFTNGTGKAEITYTGHGAVPGDYVTLSGAVLGTVTSPTAAEVNAEHRIIGTPDANTIEVVFPSAADASVSDGGSAIDATLQINVGLDTYVIGGGWGAGSWGSGTWGGATDLDPATQLRLWSLDNFGNDMIANVRTGGLYYWDESSGVGTRAIAFEDLTRRTVSLQTNPFFTFSGSSTVRVYDVAHGAGVGDEVTISSVGGPVDGIPASEFNTTHTITAIITDSIYEIVVTTNATTGSAGGTLYGGSGIGAVYNAGVFYTPTAALQIMTSPTARHIIAFGCNAAGASAIEPLLVRWCSSELPADWRPTDQNTAGDFPLSTGSKFIGALRTRQEIIIWTDVGLVSMRYVGRPFVFSFTDIEGGTSMISPNAAVNAGGRVYYMDRGGFYIYAGAVQRLPCAVRDYVFSRIDLSNAFKVVAGSNEDFSEVIWFYPSTSGGGEIDSYVKFNYDENLWDYGALARGTWNNTPTNTEPRASGINIQALGSGAITAVSGDQTVTIAAPSHGLAVGDLVILRQCGSVGGIDADVLNTQWAVATVPDDDTFTIEVSDQASSNETGGAATSELYKAHHIYAHEVGFNADGANLNAYVESGDIDIEDGHHFQFVDRFVPDVEWRGDASLAELTVTMKTKDFPLGNERTPVDVTIMQDTNQKHVRLRGRQMRYKIESNGTGFGWRAGKFRFSIRQDGRR